VWGLGEADSSAALRNDNQKGNGNGKCKDKRMCKGKYRGLSATIRFGRDNGVGGWEKQIPPLRCGMTTKEATARAQG
jgi:hypothetical protein